MPYALFSTLRRRPPWQPAARSIGPVIWRCYQPPVWHAYSYVVLPQRDEVWS